MSNVIKVEKVNEVHLRVFCEDMGVEADLVDFFTYEYPGAKFTPQYRARLWDGKVRLFDSIRKTLYVGLYDYLERFAETHKCVLQNLNEINNHDDITVEEVQHYATSLKLHGHGRPIDIRDYQLDAIHSGLSNRRGVLLSPTGSGKSLIIYTMCRWHLDRSRRALVVVPTTSLVEQMYSDFEDYSSNNGWSVADHCQKLYSGFPKEFDRKVLFTTWQSIFKQPKEWFDQFDVVIGDECLHPDTMISMADGSKVPIKDVSVGDLVITFNEETLDIEPKPVVKVHHNISVNEQMFELALNNTTTIKITGNHKVLLTSGVWKRVDELEVGDIINSIE